MRTLPIRDAERGITLQAALQILGWVETGGQAKLLIQSGEVALNGTVETRRSHRVVQGDVIAYAGDEVEITSDDH